MECNICTLSIPPELMHKDGRTKTGYSNSCESCYQERLRTRHRELKRKYRSDPEKSENIRTVYREWQLKKYYGLSLEKFEAMLSGQGGRCAACGADNPRWSKGWCIDHDHMCCEKAPTCGKCVRGILCMPCNMSIGTMKESVSGLLAVASYLEQMHSQRKILKGKDYEPPNLEKVLGL